VGFPIPERRGEFGLISAWQHPQCSRVSDASRKSLQHQLWGLLQLHESDQNLVLSELCSSEAAPLDEIRPEDEAFFQSKPTISPMEPSESLTRTLLPFQKEGLSWLVQQEHSDCAGGILADEMGMGKTIQMVAMLVQRKQMANNALLSSDEANNHGAGPTLIVCPTSAMPQWADEICSFTEEGTLSVATYYGDRKSFSSAVLQEYDVVVTTYPVVEREWRTIAENMKVECKYCGKRYMPRALTVHNQYFCGPGAAKSEALQYKEKKNNDANDTADAAPEADNSSDKRTGQRAETMQKGMRTLGIGKQEDRQQLAERKDVGANGSGEGNNARKRAVPTPMAVYNEMMEAAGRKPMSMGEIGMKRQAKEGEHDNAANEDAGNIAKHENEEGNAERPTNRDADDDDHNQPSSASAPSTAIAPKEGKTQQKSAGKRSTRKSDRQPADSTKKRKRSAAKDDEGEEQEDNTKVEARGEGLRENEDFDEPHWQRTRSSSSNQRKSEDGPHHEQDEHRKQNSGTEGLEKMDVESDKESDKDFDVNQHVTWKGKLGKRRPNDIPALESSDEEEAQKGAEDEGAQQPSCKKEASSDGKSAAAHDDKSNTKQQQNEAKAELDEETNDKEGKEKRKGKGKGKKKQRGENGAGQLTNEKDASSGKSKSKGRSKGKGKGTDKSKSTQSEMQTQKQQQMDSATERASEDAGTIAWELDEDTLGTEQDLDMGQSVLHAVRWSRIILDEAHKIKSRTTNSAKSVFALQATFKWCITGTPLQNRVGELFSLVRFLKLDPFAYYFCKNKKCNCKSLNWNFGPMARRCVKCGHPPMQHYSYFNQYIMNPINRYGYVGDGKQAMIRLKQDIMDRLQLRRTKQERENDMKMPPLDIEVNKIKLSDEERDFYESIYKLSASKFDTFVQKGTVLHNYAHIFELLARLRQAVDHPFLILQRDDEMDQVSAPAKREEPAYYCGICQEEVDVEGIAVSGCNHTFHRSCILEFTSMVIEQATCPVCKVALSIDMQPQDLSNVPKHVQQQQRREKEEDVLGSMKKRSVLSRLNMDQYQPSAKIEGLVKSLQQMREESSENKAIVFSQYTNMIDLTEWRLKKAGIHVVKLLGSMPLKQRRAVLQSFRNDSTVSCILLSLKAGGEGLNLQAASHVMVLEPWWNPAVESQAIQRAHRIGQTKRVKAVRFCVEDTIEEKMLQLQEKKQLAFDGCVDGSVQSLAQLTGEDLGFLFKR